MSCLFSELSLANPLRTEHLFLHFCKTQIPRGLTKSYERRRDVPECLFLISLQDKVDSVVVVWDYEAKSPSVQM